MNLKRQFLNQKRLLERNLCTCVSLYQFNDSTSAATEVSITKLVGYNVHYDKSLKVLKRIYMHFLPIGSLKNKPLVENFYERQWYLNYGISRYYWFYLTASCDIVFFFK